MIIHIGEKPNRQINNADTTGIHKLYRLILADRPMVKVGAAINATTAGIVSLNTERCRLIVCQKVSKNPLHALLMKAVMLTKTKDIL